VEEVGCIDRQADVVGRRPVTVVDACRIAVGEEQRVDVAKARRYQGVGNLVEMMLSMDTEIVKIQVAVGMVTELGAAGTDIARGLVQSVIDSSDDSLMNLEGLSGVQVLVSIVSA